MVYGWFIPSRDVFEDDLEKDRQDRGLAKDRQMEGSNYEVSVRHVRAQNKGRKMRRERRELCMNRLGVFFFGLV